MADRHLNLFYTYNRDNELIENNMTRAFIVFLSIVSGETRHRILSMLLKRSRKTIDGAAKVVDLNFTDARFALQSNIDWHLSRNVDRKLLLTVSTEPLDTASITAATEVESTDENDSGPTSVPDAWVYSDSRTYYILIEAKVGSYPLNIGQLEAHANDWFGSSLQSLDSRDSLCSITWIDVLETLRSASNDHSSLVPPEKELLSHVVEFMSYYGYRLFDGFEFSGLCAPPDAVVGHLPTIESRGLYLAFHQLGSPPDFTLAYRPSHIR